MSEEKKPASSVLETDEEFILPSSLLYWDGNVILKQENKYILLGDVNAVTNEKAIGVTYICFQYKTNKKIKTNLTKKSKNQRNVMCIEYFKIEAVCSAISHTEIECCDIRNKFKEHNITKENNNWLWNCFIDGYVEGGL